jgi:hypothetical protein
MNDPVFVIHGVSNRDKADFEDQVAHLQAATGDHWDMKAVYWGDLGADDRWIDVTIPTQDEHSPAGPTGPSEIRDEFHATMEPTTDPAGSLAATLLATLPIPAEAIIRDGSEESRPQIVASAAAHRLAGPNDQYELRDGSKADAVQTATVQQVIIEGWGRTTWLRQVTDRSLLEEIGVAIAAPLAEPGTAVRPAGEELRDEELRGLDLQAFIKRRLSDLDHVVGATIGAVAGRLNTYLRTEQGPGVTRFIGDVLVYQRHRKEIHDRVRLTVDAVNPALGRDFQHPVRVIGHSLGGVIAVDMATAIEPLWTSALVTFGSQSPFFHVCDPRGGQLKPFHGQQLVQLPPSLGAWTNLWEPMDLLAFIAARVFRLHDGSPPLDLPIAHLTSSGMWTHSAYWHLPQAISEIEKALER